MLNDKYCEGAFELLVITVLEQFYKKTLLMISAV